VILLSLPPEHWDYRHVPPYLSQNRYFADSSKLLLYLKWNWEAVLEFFISYPAISSIEENQNFVEYEEYIFLNKRILLFPMATLATHLQRSACELRHCSSPG
jgi:hypothetical protein